VALFRAILDRAEGVPITRHEYEDTWSFLRTRDKKIHLEIPEMLEALRDLASEPAPTQPFVLLAGERRAYNANQIFRDPAWRKTDRDGAMRMHPDDARALGLVNGARATCTSDTGSIEVTIEIDDTVRTGMVTLPHGYGMRYQGGAPQGPQINRLTASDHCDPLARTPYHKHVPVTITPRPGITHRSR
jgi:anaerobic selenocysteine-containing dehydrogenase